MVALVMVVFLVGTTPAAQQGQVVRMRDLPSVSGEAWAVSIEGGPVMIYVFDDEARTFAEYRYKIDSRELRLMTRAAGFRVDDIAR
jgi:hypothetical protein